ncbi:erythromycin resistance leader peptide [Sporosarcina newyorkensis]
MTNSIRLRFPTLNR